jgi:hypothetical protein
MCDSLVVGAQEFCHADEGLVGQGPVRVGRYGRRAGDVGENFTALGVYLKEPRGSVESDSLKMAKQGVGGRTGVALWAMNRVADTDDFATVGDSTGQRHLVVVLVGSVGVSGRLLLAHDESSSAWANVL